MKTLRISSSLFDNNGWMPDRCSGYGEDQSPALAVEDIPEGTVTLAVIMDDLDHPVFREFNHWTAWNIPSVNLIPEALPGGAVSEEPFHIEQGVGYGKHIYRGPKPPFNSKHRYRFRVFALDTRLRLRNGSRKKDLVSAMDGHILAAGELMGIYQRNISLILPASVLLLKTRELSGCCGERLKKGKHIWRHDDLRVTGIPAGGDFRMMG